MSNISGVARLGTNPELKYVEKDGQDKQPVCELRLRFINSKQDKVSGEWQDNGFWARVNLWGKFAEPAAKMYSKGDRVYVIDGNMVMTSWADKDDENKLVSGIKVDTRMVVPYLPDLASIQYKERSSQTDDTAADAPATATA